MADIEELTDDERERLVLQDGGVSGSVARKALRIIKEWKARAEAAESLLARAQDGRAKRPREASRDGVQLDYDIGRHLQRHGWQWDAINRMWRVGQS